LLCFKDGGKFDEVPFQPDLPAGANAAFIGCFLSTGKEHKSTLPLKGLPELRLLDVKQGWQRRGIGKLLLGKVVKTVDGRGLRRLVRSSKMGKGLYENVR
jgi:GNAT superfamily N-acetyltransferase